MLYRNIKTGAVVDVQSEVKGDWEPVKAPVSVPAEPETAEKKAADKKTAKPKTKKK